MRLLLCALALTLYASAQSKGSLPNAPEPQSTKAFSVSGGFSEQFKLSDGTNPHTTTAYGSLTWRIPHTQASLGTLFSHNIQTGVQYQFVSISYHLISFDGPWHHEARP